jgi:FKBP-type peptidyl-prolyl cis-trans isomerase SlyD
MVENMCLPRELAKDRDGDKELDMNEKPKIVADDIVVSLDYKLTVGGEVVDSTDDSDPLEFLQGHGNIIPGLEKELYGLGIGDHKSITVQAKDAYGETDPDAIVDVPRSEFPSEIPLEVGVQLQVRDTNGNVMDARIENVGKDSVKLNFNHPLAGENLQFEVSITALRPPTEEELAHGHVHGEHGHDDEYDLEDLEDEDIDLYGDDDDEDLDDEEDLESEGFYIVDEDESGDEELDDNLKLN